MEQHQRVFSFNVVSHKDRVLVPLLMYASGLLNVVEPHLPGAHAFADDSQLYVHSSLPKTQMKLLQSQQCKTALMM